MSKGLFLIGIYFIEFINLINFYKKMINEGVEDKTIIVIAIILIGMGFLSMIGGYSLRESNLKHAEKEKYVQCLEAKNTNCKELHEYFINLIKI